MKNVSFYLTFIPRILLYHKSHSRLGALPTILFLAFLARLKKFIKNNEINHFICRWRKKLIELCHLLWHYSTERRGRGDGERETSQFNPKMQCALEFRRKLQQLGWLMVSIVHATIGWGKGWGWGRASLRGVVELSLKCWAIISRSRRNIKNLWQTSINLRFALGHDCIMETFLASGGELRQRGTKGKLIKSKQRNITKI